MTTTALLDRLAFDPGSHAAELAPIPWPDGLAPARPYAPQGATSIPPADVLVITWTAAEGRALADVLTPGIESSGWTPYRTGWQSYLPQLTRRSPARQAERLGSWCMTTIGSAHAVCFKSELHPATDGPTLPAARLAAQLAGECDARLVITTGTAGGAGDGTLLADVNVAARVHADFTTKLKGHPWSGQAFAAAQPSVQQAAYLAATGPMIAVNLGRIPAQPRLPKIWAGDTVSTDFFCYDTEDDHYGLRAYDPGIRAVEMDDAAVCAGIAGRVPVASVRNASDPVMASADAADANQAAEIYRRYGYWTTIGSAICTWALIAGLG